MALRDKHKDKLGKFPMGGDIKMYGVQENKQDELKMKTETECVGKLCKNEEKVQSQKVNNEIRRKKIVGHLVTERMKKVKRHIKNKKKQKADDREQKEDIN